MRHDTSRMHLHSPVHVATSRCHRDVQMINVDMVSQPRCGLKEALIKAVIIRVQAAVF